ncbi:MAG: tetratricopeptide repeat protein [Candidatus Aminicenantes bacterium]|nr:tetratricopeptide repeat protein [Candidatus Aminicenantes bacterium]
MKKLLSWLVILCFSLLWVMSFSGCQSLKISNLKANDHFKKGNGFYTKEQFKNAVEEYEIALEFNPDLKIAYFYVGTACSRSYKAGINPPEQNEGYNKKIEQNQQLKAQIEENNQLINDFIASNTEFTTKLNENKEIREKIKETEKEMSFIRGYEGYLEMLSDKEEFARRIRVNDEYVLRLEQDLAAKAIESESAEKKEEDIFKEEEDSSEQEEIKRLKEDKEKMLKEIEEKGKAIALFEKQEDFQKLNKVKQEHLGMISTNEEFFKTIEGYDEYEKKVGENQDHTKIIKSNETYMKRVEDNEEFRKKAIEYLLKAKEFQPDDERITLALSEIYDKMGNFEEAEKYYLSMLDKAKDNPKAYYTLADFYKKNGQFAKAETMYERRVALNPENPEGYLFYINFLQDMRKWDKAIECHKKRISIVINPNVLNLHQEIMELERKVDRINSIDQYIKNVQGNKSIPEDQKEKLLAEKQEQKKEIGDLETIQAQLKEKQAEVDQLVELSDEEVNNLPEEKKEILGDAYYRLGVVFWNKSYQTPRDLMGPKERLMVVDQGFESLDKATALRPEFPDPWAYKKLLYLQKIVAEPLKAEIHNQKGNEMGAKFTEMRKKLLAREAYLKQLEQTGTEE